MKTAIFPLLLLFGIAVLGYLLFRKDSILRRNLTRKGFFIAIAAVIIFIVFSFFMTKKQLAIMINSGQQMPFLKETAQQKQEEDIPEEADVQQANAFVIEIITTQIKVEDTTFDSYEEAENTIRECAFKHEKAVLIDNYAENQTYMKVKNLLVSCGIEEGNIQENQDF